MSDDYLSDDELETNDEGLEDFEEGPDCEELDSEDEFEEITSDEVDRVIESLEGLIETVESENIKAYLEEALNQVYYLIYEDEEDEDASDSGPISEAA